MDYYIARDNDGSLFIYSEIPTLIDGHYDINHECLDSPINLPMHFFENIKPLEMKKLVIENGK